MVSTTKTKGPSPESAKSQEPRARGRSTAPASNSGGGPRPSGTRETIESIVVAFMLAFLFKTFEAEAFVIPTGSMAPTLLGRNKTVVCPKCGTKFTIGASDEVDGENDYLLPGMRIEGAMCPNCRYRLEKKDVYNLPVFKGDRILVTKFSYELADPRRWDVVVFKYPEEPKTNYIKRCVGLPNDTIELFQGNVYRISGGKKEILRKDDPNKQRALQLLVYDNDHPERDLLKAGWPERWAAVKKTDAPDAVAGWSLDTQGWTGDESARTFHLTQKDSAAADLRWIRYRNFVPDADAWDAALSGRRPQAPKPKLVTDFCGYNAFSNERMPLDDAGLYWVGELTINCGLDVQQVGSGGQVVLELNQGARAYRCRLDLSDGKATLAYLEPREGGQSAEEQVVGTAITACKGAGHHDVSFANVDHRLCLWLDDRLIDFGPGARYQPYRGLAIQPPRDADLIPVGIGARAVDMTVSALRLQRDIYYRGDFVYPRGRFDDGTSFGQVEEYSGENKHDLTDRLDNPTEWFREYQRGLASRQTGPGQQFEHVNFQFTMGPDEFFVMGDNSPRSKDSRLWSNTRHAAHRYAVPRIALVGKALFVYWPHGIPFLDHGRGYPDGPDSVWSNKLTAPFFYQETRDAAGNPVIDTDYPKLRVPFYPDIARMHRIR